METETNSKAKTPETTAQPKNSNNKLIIAIVALAAVIVASTAVIVDTISRNRSEGGENIVVNGITIDYETDAKVFLDQNSLQAAMDEALKNAQDRNVALRYRNDAYSQDGQNFECYVANSSGNLYDMFLTICTDETMTDQLFLSKLLRPGTGYDHITLDRALEPGTHTVYVAVTLVDTDPARGQVIKAQAVHTMDFHVAG